MKGVPTNGVRLPVDSDSSASTGGAASSVSLPPPCLTVSDVSETPVVLLPEIRLARLHEEFVEQRPLGSRLALLNRFVGLLHLQGFNRITLCLRRGEGVFVDSLMQLKPSAVTLDCRVEERREAEPAQHGVPRLSNAQPHLFISSDIALDVDLARVVTTHCAQRFDATVVMREFMHQVPYGVLRLRDGYHLAELVEKPIERFTVSAGIYVFNAATVRALAADSGCDLDRVFARLIEEGAIVGSLPLSECRLTASRYGVEPGAGMNEAGR